MRALARIPSPLALVAIAACGGGGGGDGSTGIAPAAAPISTFETGFVLRQDVALGGGGVTDVEAVDLDGDGLSDLVETDFGQRRVSGALGNADGSFTPVLDLPTTGTPWALEVGDVTGDGLVDIVAICIEANGGTPSVVLFRGLGGTSFVEDASVVLPSDPLGLALAKAPGAARLQVFVAVPISGVWQLEWTGPGALTQVRVLPRSQTGYRPFTVAVLDVDGDGLDDVAAGEIGDRGTDRVTVHLSDGSGGFLPPTELAQVQYGLIENAGDVDGDGTDDLVVSQLESTQVLLFLGGPTGFGAPLALDPGGIASSVVFADLDGDGLKDMSSALVGEAAVSVQLASAPLVFGPAAVLSVGETPRWLTTGRFREPEHVDLVCANIDDVSILHGAGDGTMRGTPGFLVGGAPQTLRVVDMDQDGIDDVVTLDLYQRKVAFLRGGGDGSFVNEGEVILSPTQVETTGYLLVEDFDGDGRPDLATTVHADRTVQVVPNQGSLPFAPPEPQDSTPVGADPLGLDAGDLDGDGNLDIVVANSGEDSIQVLLGNGDFTFDAQLPFALPYRPLAVILEDWNLDGALDTAIASGTRSGTDPYLLATAGDGLGGLSLAGVQPMPHVTSALSSGDLDEDGFEDLVASGPRTTSDTVLVMRSNGLFTFSIESVQAGFRIGTVEVVDVDRDTHLDLAVPLRDGRLVVALGDGLGGFPKVLPPAGEEFPAPFGVTSSSFVDLDGDGLLDLLGVSPRAPYLWVSRNEGTLFGELPSE